MQFKVGDRVKRIDWSMFPDPWEEIGDVGSVVEVGSINVKVELDKNGKISDTRLCRWEVLKEETNKSKMEKFYRVKKDLPTITAGAVLKVDGDDAYVPVNDLYNTDAVKQGKDPRFNVYMVENAPEWFERVYPVSLLTKTVYKLKEEAKEFFSKEQTA